MNRPFLSLRHIFDLKYLAIGLVIASTGFQFGSTVVETTRLTADRDLSNYWRTSYDILVRPVGARSPIEAEYGLVEANHLSGINGGISVSQYEAIKAIPGVEVAAPIAMLGFIPERLQVADFGLQTSPGFYSVLTTLEIDNGVTVYRDIYAGTNFYVGTDAESGYKYIPDVITAVVNPAYPIISRVDLPLLMAGIEPTQEAQLVGLNQALVQGEDLETALTDPSYEQAFHRALQEGWIQSKYLDGAEPVQIQQTTDPEGNPAEIVIAPVLINATPYVNLKLRAELKRWLLPPEADTLDSIINLGGWDYLDSLPTEVVSAYEIYSDQAYRQLATNLLLPDNARASNPFPFPEVSTVQNFAAGIPGQVQYEVARTTPTDGGLVLGLVLPDQTDDTGTEMEPAYRKAVSSDATGENYRFQSMFKLNAVGVFNLENLPEPEDINRVPLETYFPPLATLRYNEDGQPVEPRTLLPTLNTSGYIQPPPLMLTTLEAARLIAGEDCISAIRVRVAGINRLDRTAQQKIEAIASEIHRITGLDVDIMVGSSPKRILVHVPEIGYVEEQWIQKGVNTQIGQSLNQTNLFLLWVYGGVCILFVLAETVTSVLRRQREIGLLKAFGWRSRSVFASIIGEILTVGLMAALLGTSLAVGLSSLFQLNFTWSQAIRSFVITIGLCLVGSSLPAWRGMQNIPAMTLQMGEIQSGEKRRLSGNYTLQSLLRRPARSLMVLISQAIGSGLVVLILLAIVQSQGYLVGTLTLLGEYIQQRIEGYHYLITVLCLLLSALSLGDQMILAIREQSHEIGLLMAVGWRKREVFSTFIAQGLYLGIAGGILGGLGAAAFFVLLTGDLSWNTFWFGALGAGLSIATGGISAWIPARMAARVDPVESMHIGV